MMADTMLMIACALLVDAMSSAKAELTTDGGRVLACLGAALRLGV